MTNTTTTYSNQYNTDSKLENTPPLVCFPVWHLSCANKRCWARNNTLVGVISYSASFVGTPTHTEHEMTPLVSFCAWILFYPLEWMLRSVYYIFYILLNSNYIYICLNIYSSHRNSVGILHLSSWDGNSAGMGAGQTKTPCGTPVSITTAKPLSFSHLAPSSIWPCIQCNNVAGTWSF